MCQNPVSSNAGWGVIAVILGLSAVPGLAVWQFNWPQGVVVIVAASALLLAFLTRRATDRHAGTARLIEQTPITTIADLVEASMTVGADPSTRASVAVQGRVVAKEERRLTAPMTVGVSGLGEWKAYVDSGRMRVLAVSSPERVGDGGVPTIRESGLDVAIANWRGIVAPPGTDRETRDWLVTALEGMRDSAAWQDILRANEWEDSFLAGPAFEQFLRDEAATVDMTLRAIGLIQ